MFKKIVIPLFVVLLLVFGGLSFYVSTIDWNTYKNKITTEIEDVTGKKVVINGQINLTFFPTPHLTATDIKVYNPRSEKPNEALAQIKEMVTDLSFLPLLHKRFEVEQMSLTDAHLLVEFLNDGKTNWYSNVDEDQRLELAGIDIEFNSITLQNSTVRLINPALNIDTTLKKLNADISAQSLAGPFRMDGNFIKDETPAGFALNVGTLSESFATSLNLVLTHPSSDSYARFDGSIQSNNSEIQGNFTVESQKPSTFLNTISGQNLLPEKYNYPLASSIELIVNPNQVDLSSFIIKYGENMAGAGKVLIPLKPTTDNNKKDVQLAFEMTDLDVMPFVAFLKEYFKKFENGQKYEPLSEYNLAADISATRAHYNNDVIRNFKLTADYINDVLNIKNLSGLMPGDTDVSVQGNVFEHEKILSYDFKVQGLSQDFLKFLEFTGNKPDVYAQSTYRNAHAAFGLSGNLNQIKIMPFDFGFDKIETTGAIGIKRDRRNSFFVTLQSDNINFDNYLPQLSEEEQKQSLTDKIKIFLHRFKFLNDIDLQAKIDLKLGIYNKIPFENLILNMNASSGNIEFKKLDIEQIASAKLAVEGNISDLNLTPNFENLKYNLSTADFPSFAYKVGLKLPKWPLFEKARTMESKGILSGTFENINIKSASKIEKISVNYDGRLYAQDNKSYWRGNIELRAPDFIDFTDQIGIDYSPENLSGNILTLKSKIEGTDVNWRATEINSFIGPNNFTGAFSYTLTNSKPLIKANIAANLFEFDRFIFKPESGKRNKQTKSSVSFIQKPVFNNTPFNFEAFKKFDLSGNFDIKNLSYLSNDIENVKCSIDIKNGFIDVKDFRAEKNSAPIKSNFSIDINSKPKIKGTLEVNDYPLDKFGGTTYSITQGKLNFKTNLEGSLTSETDFLKTGQGDISFEISKADIKGLDIAIIENDLDKRTHSDNLDTFLTNNLSGGQSYFDFIGGHIAVSEGKYTFKDVIMTSPLADIDIISEGSIGDWNMDTSFNVTLERIKENILPFSFSLKGSIANPSLFVDAANLKNKYDSYWQQIEEEKRKAEEDRINALKQRMDKAQKVVNTQIDTLNNDILPRIKHYQPLSSDAQISSVYESIYAQANEMLKKLKEFKTLRLSKYKDADIDKINLQTEAYKDLYPELIKQLDENYVFDLKLHIVADNLKINNIYKNSTEKSKNYQETLNAYTMRLVQLASIVVLDNLEQVKTDRNNIEKAIQNISDIHTQAIKIRELSENEKLIAKLDEQYKKINQLAKDATSELEKLNEDLEDLFEYVQDVVYFEQTGKHKIKDDTAPKDVQNSQENLEQKLEEKEKSGIRPEKFKKENEHIDEILYENVQDTAENGNMKKEEQTEEEKEEKNQETEVPSADEEKVEPAKPLLIEASDEYISKTPASGQIIKKGAKTSQARASSQEENTSEGSFLRPLQGEVSIEGKVSRK